MSREINSVAVPSRASSVRGWTLLEYDEVGSTNFVAAKLAAWHAVRADRQTAGRGRFQRSWVSDAGGLWLSAVVPTCADRQQNQSLPLVAGLAVIDALKESGVTSARLRWPNDIMVEEKKIAGLLVDSFAPRLAVIGLGVNVTNQPAAYDPSLCHTATRLADLIGRAPTLGVLTEAILVSLRSAVEEWNVHGFAALRPRINERWGAKRRVKLDLDGKERVGFFTGVDDRGSLLLEDDFSTATAFDAHEVKLLREI